MKLGRKSTLAEVAADVSKALSSAGIVGVLTGGACASLYTKGAYHSEDLDFILRGPVSRARLDQAMREAGFARRGDQYFHARVPFFVEFPPGPLAIGKDFEIRPVEYRVGRIGVPALSPTDSCRDRLAAFYHWSDRQSLRVAVDIARRHPVDLESIRRWSLEEGFAPAFEEFRAELRSSPRRRGARAGRRPATRR